jgi:hypothetical protein
MKPQYFLSFNKVDMSLKRLLGAARRETGIKLYRDRQRIRAALLSWTIARSPHFKFHNLEPGLEY